MIEYTTEVHHAEEERQQQARILDNSDLRDIRLSGAYDWLQQARVRIAGCRREQHANSLNTEVFRCQEVLGVLDELLAQCRFTQGTKPKPVVDRTHIKTSEGIRLVDLGD